MNVGDNHCQLTVFTANIRASVTLLNRNVSIKQCIWNIAQEAEAA